MDYSKRAYDSSDRTGKFIQSGPHEAWIYEEADKVYVAFRGTEGKFSDIITDLRTWPSKVKGGWCHSGFLDGARQLAPYLSQYLVSAVIKGKQIVFTGHSMGGSLAEVYGYLWRWPNSQVVAIAPAACLRVRKYPVPLHYVVNGPDPVTRLRFLGIFQHQGHRLQLGEQARDIYGLLHLTTFSLLKLIRRDTPYHKIDNYIEDYNALF